MICWVPYQEGRNINNNKTTKQLNNNNNNNNSNSSNNNVHRRLGEASFPDTKLVYRLISKNPSVNLPHHRPPAARPLGPKRWQNDPRGRTARSPSGVGQCRRRHRTAGKSCRTLQEAGTGQQSAADKKGREDITKGCCRPGTVRGLICFPLPSLEANG